MKKTRLHYFYLPLFLMIVLGVLGCESKPKGLDSGVLAQKFYSLLSTQDFKSAAAMFNSDLPDDVKQPYLESLYNKLGKLQKVTLLHSEVNTIFSGRRFIFDYQVQYEKDRTRETLVLFLNLEENQLTVVTYSVDADNL